ncbi:Vacuolar protein sorting-associated protein ist1 [Schizosaccharomyces pombe]
MSRLQIQLKLAASRIEILRQKEEALAKQARRNVALGLKSYSPALAKARIEPLIMQDIYIELLELLQVDVEILANRCVVLEKRAFNDSMSFKSSLYHVMAAAPQLQIKELRFVHDFLVKLYGKEFARLSDPDLATNDTAFYQLLYPPIPKDELVEAYRKELIRTYFPNEYPKEANKDIPSSAEADTMLNLESSENREQPTSLKEKNTQEDDEKVNGNLANISKRAEPQNNGSTNASSQQSSNYLPTNPTLTHSNKAPSFEELAARLDRLKHL